MVYQIEMDWMQNFLFIDILHFALWLQVLDRDDSEITYWHTYLAANLPTA